MSIWTTAKNSALKVKLQGEISYFDREANIRQKKFGVDLYDLLTSDKNKLLGVAAGTIFQGKQAEFKVPFDKAREDIAGIQAKKDVKQKDLDVLEVKSSDNVPDSTMNEKMKKAGKAVADAGKAAKLKAEMALLDREIKVRKEQFGVEVFDLLKNDSSEGDHKSGISGAVQSALSNVSQQEKDIQTCIDEAKADVALIEGKITSRRREIAALEEEMKTGK